MELSGVNIILNIVIVSFNEKVLEVFDKCIFFENSLLIKLCIYFLFKRKKVWKYNMFNS